MADKVAELKAGDGQPVFEINAFKPNDLIRGTFKIRLFNKADTKSVVIGDSGGEVDNPKGSFNIPFENDVSDLDDRFIRFRVFVADDEETDSGDWFLSIKIKQKNKIVSGGDIQFKTNLDSISFIGDKVRLNVT
ncbi:MAG TPA: hypothetical protein VF721_22250 [Pyrinomonadaceae bacterium]|jgi:hypothetical protein